MVTVLLTLLAFVAPPPAAGATKADITQVPLPSPVEMTVPYVDLLMVLEVPDDEALLGAAFDLGYWTGSTYKGVEELPPAYWLYVAPYWYLYGKVLHMPPPIIEGVSCAQGYDELVGWVYAPTVAQSVEACHEAGWWTTSAYGGAVGLPPGFWVYSPPHWLIFARKTGASGPKAEVPAKASVKGKYTTLLRVLHVPDDKKKYGAFHDLGYWFGTSYAGYTDIPPGWWVYVHPDWYVWKSRPTK